MSELRRISKYDVNKIYVVNLTRENIWLIADALRNMATMESVRKKQIKILLKDFEKFERKISEFINKERDETGGDSE